MDGISSKQKLNKPTSTERTSSLNMRSLGKKKIIRVSVSQKESKQAREKKLHTKQCSLMKIGTLQIPLIHCHTVQDPVNNSSPYHKPVFREKCWQLLATNHIGCSF